MTDNFSYCFTIFYGNVEKNCTEHSLALMASNETPPRYFVRFTNKLDSTLTYEQANKFEPEFIALLSYVISEPTFHFTAFKDESGVKLIRVYVSATFDFLRTTLHVINIEQLLSDLIKVRKNDIIIEPEHFFRYNTNVFIKPLQKLSTSLYERYIIPTQRHLSSEQRQNAQELVDVLQSSHLQHYSYYKNIAINSNIMFNLDKNEFDHNVDNDHLVVWSPNKSLVPFIRGCGRKRTFAALLTSINEGHLKSNKNLSTFLFKAEKSAIVICSEDKINGWIDELKPKTYVIIAQENDFDTVTYSSLLSGLTIIVTPHALSLLKSQSSVESEQVQQMIDYDKRIPLDSQRASKFHRLNLSSRMPRSKAPLSFIQFKCIICDEFTGNDILNELHCDWMFNTIGFDGNVPNYLSKIITTQKYFPSLKLNSSETHDIWRILNEKHSNLIIPFQYPKVIMKKITIIPMPFTLSALENQFIESLEKIKKTESLVLQKSQISNILIGCDVFGKDTNINSCLKRLSTVDFECAIKLCHQHYKDDPKGTFAQRVLNETKNKRVSESSFVEKSLLTMINGECQICMEDKISSATLCGHGFCTSCKTMLRAKENDTGMISCPVCRAELSQYDWLNFGQTSKSKTAEEESFVISKIQTIISALNQIVLKRKSKKRLPLHAILLVKNKEAKESIESLIRQYFVKNNIDSYLIASEISLPNDQSETNDMKPRVTLLTSEEMNREIFEQYLIDGVVMSCPESLSVFYKLIRFQYNRMNSLQVRIVFATGHEYCDSDVEDIIRVML